MKVEAVENKRHSCLMPMAEGALIGSAVGFVTKYAYPLNSDEKNSAQYRRSIKAINDQKNLYGPETEQFLKEIKDNKLKSPAEDAFVKMFDGLKDGDKMTFARKKDALQTIAEKNPDYKGEFKALCNQLREVAERNTKKGIEACEFAMKHIRPTSFFVIGGAVIGAIIALFHDVLRTDVKN